jgi:hypothetical protein
MHLSLEPNGFQFSTNLTDIDKNLFIFQLHLYKLFCIEHKL